MAVRRARVEGFGRRVHEKALFVARAFEADVDERGHGHRLGLSGAEIEFVEGAARRGSFPVVVEDEFGHAADAGEVLPSGRMAAPRPDHAGVNGEHRDLFDSARRGVGGSQDRRPESPFVGKHRDGMDLDPLDDRCGHEEMIKSLRRDARLRARAQGRLGCGSTRERRARS